MNVQLKARDNTANIPAIEEAQAEQYVDKIHALRKHWVQRHHPLPYYTLGVSAYEEGREEPSSYSEKLKSTNVVLRKNFGCLYDRVADVLREAFGSQVFYSDRLALPGFHVLGSSTWFALPFATPHFDGQFRLLDWTGMEDVDFSNPKTFTLPLKVPGGGAGLDMWDIDKSKEEERVYSREPDYCHEYIVGELTLTDGLYRHRMAPYINVKDSDQRITFQGHAVSVGNQWCLYW